MTLSKETRDGLKSIGTGILTIAAIVYGWLAFFVLWLDYDYVTTSSILFTLFLAVLLVGNFGTIVEVVREKNGWGGFGLFIGVLLALAALTGGLGIFSAIHHPGVSDRFDMVMSFWRVLGWPFVAIVRLIASMVPPVGEFVRACVDWANGSSVISNTVGTLLATSLTTLFFRKRLVGG